MHDRIGCLTEIGGQFSEHAARALWDADAGVRGMARWRVGWIPEAPSVQQWARARSRADAAVRALSPGYRVADGARISPAQLLAQSMNLDDDDGDIVPLHVSAIDLGDVRVDLRQSGLNRSLAEGA